MKRTPEAAAKGVQMFDLLVEFFDDGRHWIRDYLSDDGDRRCLVSAMAHLWIVHDLHGDATRAYLQRAMPYRDYPLAYFNDRFCKEFADVAQFIARALADMVAARPQKPAA